MPIFTGTSGDDSIVGSVSADTIDGGLGNDTLDGGGGSDSIQGGGGNDVVNVAPAAGASDIVDGGSGSDVLNLGALASGAAFSLQTQTNGHFSLGLAQGGGAFALDLVNLEAVHVAANTLASATFTANTGAVTNVVLLQSGSQVIVEGSNIPAVSLDNLAAGATLRVTSGAGNDSLDASRVGQNGHANVLDSGGGNDTLQVMNSTALAGAGDDTINWFFGGSGSIDGGAGNDVENITFGGNTDTATLSASNGHVIEGLDGKSQDVVGVETINIATGDRADTVTVGDLSGTSVTKVNIDLSGATAGQADGAVDAVTLAGARAGGQVTTTFGADHTSAQVVYTVGGAVVETVNITHADPQDTLQVGSGPVQHFGSTPGVFIGTSADDVITPAFVSAGVFAAGTPGLEADTIDGQAGNDTLDGGGGSDSIQGGTGADLISVTPAAGASDTVDGGSGSDVLNLGALGSGAAFSLQTAASGHFNLGLAQGGGAFGLDLVNLELVHVAANTLASATFTANTAPTSNLLILQSGSQVIVEGSNIPAVTLDNLAAGAALRLVTGAGNDSLDASRVGQNGHANILDAGDGNDTLQVMNSTALAGAGDDTINWFFGGTGSIDGGIGNDVENITFGGNTDTATLSASNGHVIESLDGKSQDVVGVETINIATGDRADTVTAGDLTGTGVANLNIQAGMGADLVVVNALTTPTARVNVDLSGATAGQGDGVSDLVKVVASDSADTLATLGTANGGYQIVEPNVFNSVAISALDATDKIEVDLGGGDDSINLDLSPPFAGLTVDGGSGFDTVSGFLENVADTVTITGNHLSHGAMAADLVNVEALNLNIVGSENQSNTFVFNGSAAGDIFGTGLASGTLTVSQSGAPTVNVSGFAGNDFVSINGGAGDDELDWNRGVTMGFDGGAGSDLVSAFVGGDGEIIMGPNAELVSGGSALFLSNVEKIDMVGSFFGSNLSINAGGATSGPAVEVDLGGPFGPFTNQTMSFFESVPRSTAVTFSSVGSTTNPMGLGAFIHVDGLGAPIDIDEVGSGARFFFQGSNGADTINCGNLPVGMRISALDGADSIMGGFGHDTINGGAGNDTIVGGSDGAIFDGGSGDDLFIGGVGNDRFDWDFGNDGHDTVQFFQSHTSSGPRDQIEVSTRFGHNLGEMEFLGFIKQVGADVVLVNSTLNSFILKNVLLSQLSDADFVFI